jgi:hypothetical protein
MSLQSPEAAMASRLTASTAVFALAGNRIYPVIAPASSTLPFVVWRRASIQREQSLSAPNGVPKVMVEYQCYATTYEQVRTLADSMRRQLDGWRGAQGTIEIGNVSLENENDDFVVLQGADMPNVYQVTQQYMTLWSEPQ